MIVIKCRMMKVIHGGVRMIEIISEYKQTNADRIRSMNDEELAKFIESLLPNGIKDNKTNKNILEWLQEIVV